jgi:hypothetical protein
VDTSFHHAEAFGNKIRVAYASFCVIQEVLELSEGVWTLVDRTLLIFNPLTEHALTPAMYSVNGCLATHFRTNFFPLCLLNPEIF